MVYLSKRTQQQHGVFISENLTQPYEARVYPLYQGNMVRYVQDRVYVRFDPEDLVWTLEGLNYVPQALWHRLSCAMGRCLRGDDLAEPVDRTGMETYLGKVWEGYRQHAHLDRQ